MTPGARARAGGLDLQRHADRLAQDLDLLFRLALAQMRGHRAGGDEAVVPAPMMIAAPSQVAPSGQTPSPAAGSMIATISRDWPVMRAQVIRWSRQTRPGDDARVELAQGDAVPARKTPVDLDAAGDEFAVGAMCDRVGLDGGVDGYAWEVLWLGAARALCGSQRFGQQQFERLGADALAPAGHGGAIER